MSQTRLAHLLACLYAIARFGDCRSVDDAVRLFLSMNELEKLGFFVVVTALFSLFAEMIREGFGAARKAVRKIRSIRRRGRAKARRKAKAAAAVPTPPQSEAPPAPDQQKAA